MVKESLGLHEETLKIMRKKIENAVMGMGCNWTQAQMEIICDDPLVREFIDRGE